MFERDYTTYAQEVLPPYNFKNDDHVPSNWSRIDHAWLLRFGEGYFEGLWYCSDCWDSWQDAPAEMTTISPWPLEAGDLVGMAREA